MPVWIDGGPRRRRGRRTVALALLPALAVGGAAALLSTTNIVGDPELAAGSDVTFTGQGNGHGRGLGQWGAFGYAKAGWKAEQIVAHYYGGSQLARADVKLPVRVQLTTQKAANVLAPAGAKIGDQPVAPGQAVRLEGGNAVITTGCNGPVVKTVPAGEDATISPLNAEAGRPVGELLTFCGSNAAYRGAIAAKDGKVFNVVTIEDYVRGVVPVESKVEWADQGGYEALRAQAIAARSYALAEGAKRGDRYNDTQDSQVYGGAGKEDPRTDKAVASTAGLVMAKNGYAVSTEFSSSTGGFTAGGDFTAVKDDGDVVSPFKNWTQKVPTSKIAQEFGVGAFKSIRVVKTQSAQAGRVEAVEIVGANRTVTAKGDEVRKKLGLRSDWFTIDGQAPASAPAPGAPSAPGAATAPSSATQAPVPGRVVDQPIVAAPVDPFNPVPTAPNAAQTAPTGATTPTAAAPTAGTVAAAPAAPAAPAVPTVPGAAPAVAAAGSPAVPSAPAAAPAAPTAPAAPAIPGIPAPPAASVAAAGVQAVTGKAAVEAAYAAAGGEKGTLGRAVANPIAFPDGSILQSYQNGTIYYSKANGAQVVPSGVSAPATLLNWATAFAAGGAPSLPPLPLLNLIPGWGDVVGINPTAADTPTGVPAVPVTPGDTSAAATPGSSTPAAPAAPSAPSTPGAPAAPAAPATTAPAAPAAPSAPAGSTPLAVPTVPNAPA
ncbi:SpoIID/LytB domain-containing protein [Tsukamurella tyrosinosolvens]|uniref:SpoIID/LytB domain-containing protein n=3 Tax=Tsukamurella tyrosinosolvens TaxID=57704 RepID=UPI001AF60E84|nr:SpoIID/LytB domain-containing protein [Tsukamurella tyrosinosolvens]QRY85555.1 SpoIID/LytB domain-containing protein [Tsukamurella tyrosinosolvens]